MDVPRIDDLLDALASDRPAPAAGSAAAFTGAIAAAVCAKVAQFSDDGGSVAQAAALCRRLTLLAHEDAQVFASALCELERRDDDFKLGRALDQAADAPLRIAETCADVATLAAALAQNALPEHQTDARAAASLAAGAAGAAAVLVEANLTVGDDDERGRLARKAAAQAAEAVRIP